MKRWILACMTAVLVVMPGSAQEPTLPIIGWEIVPGALHWHGSELALTVGCQVQQRTNWTPDPLSGPRNSVLTLHLKLRSKTAGQGSEFWTYRQGLMPGSQKKPISDGLKCDLSKGLDTVTFVLTGLRGAGRSLVPSALADWQVIVRYYPAPRHEPHRGLRLANGQHWSISDSQFLDHINNYAVSPAVEAEEWYERR